MNEQNNPMGEEQNPMDAGQQYAQPSYGQPSQEQPAGYRQSVQQPQSQYAQPEYGAPRQPEHEPPKRKRGMAGWMGLIAVGGVVGGILLGMLCIAPMIATQNTAGSATKVTSESVTAEEIPTEAPSNIGSIATPITDMSNPVPEVVENLSGSVVSVVTYQKELVSGQEPIEDLMGAGTGFVISDDGYVLTNQHVVAVGNEIKVVTSDNRTLTATMVGQDADTDLAVLKVDDLNLKAVPIGNSDGTKVGEIAIAIGNPVNQKDGEMDYSSTVTVGYISALDRQIVLDGQKFNMIQTDAAINPGNSGGPLVNKNGEVIGITSAKKFVSMMDSMGNTIPSEGVSYAIPISDAMEIVNKLISDGGIPKVGIGITFSMITEEDAKLWEVPKGALVAEVTPGSPAAEAGLQQYDVIMTFDGADLTAGDEVPVLSERNVGDTITLKIWRDGVEKDLDIVLRDLNKLV